CWRKCGVGEERPRGRTERRQGARVVRRGREARDIGCQEHGLLAAGLRIDDPPMPDIPQVPEFEYAARAQSETLRGDSFCEVFCLHHVVICLWAGRLWT